MLPVTLIVISIGLLVWLAIEIRSAYRFVKEGVPVEATVSRRERVFTGNKGRDIKIILTVQEKNETKEYPMGYMSYFGFRSLQIGDRMTVLRHPAFNYVVPAGKMGIIARSFIAGSLFFASAICATAFTLSELIK